MTKANVRTRISRFKRKIAFSESPSQIAFHGREGKTKKRQQLNTESCDLLLQAMPWFEVQLTDQQLI
ncbi:MAG: hypothetical protein AAGE59_24325, partial [Cyanobacteria bacterium P01_F01_bin.86]